MPRSLAPLLCALLLVAGLGWVSPSQAAPNENQEIESTAARTTRLKPSLDHEKFDDFLSDPALIDELEESTSAACGDQIGGTFIFCIEVPVANRVTETEFRDTWKMCLEYNPETGCNELNRRLVKSKYTYEKVVIEKVKKRFRIPLNVAVSELLNAEVCDSDDNCCTSAEVPSQEMGGAPVAPDRTVQPSLNDTGVIRPAASVWDSYEAERFARSGQATTTQN